MPLDSALQGLCVLMAVVIGSIWAGAMFAHFGQPRVLGAITLGIGVGVATAVNEARNGAPLVSDTSLELVDTAGTAGLALLMFGVGNELRRSNRSSGHVRRWPLVPCVALPAAAGGAAAWLFVDQLGLPGAPPHAVSMFFGAALAVTAVPVLEAIVRDLGAEKTPVARAAMGIAVITDAAVWLAVTVLLLSTHTSTISASRLVTGAALLATTAVFIPRLLRTKPSTGHSALGAIVVTTLCGAVGSQLLGLHPAVGAVIAGFTFPTEIAAMYRRQITFTADVLLPAFFVTAAMSVPAQAIRDEVNWSGLLCALVLAVAAVLSKAVVAIIFGVAQRWPISDCAALGALLNCRGVSEIAIATVGHQAHLIGAFGFVLLCALAVTTTVATAPVYRLFVRLRSTETPNTYSLR